MNKKQMSIYISDKDLRKLEELMKTYETENKSEMIRTLIQQEYTTIQKYEAILK